MGEAELILIHGRGHNRGKSPGFLNTNTGCCGLCARRARNLSVNGWFLSKLYSQKLLLRRILYAYGRLVRAGEWKSTSILAIVSAGLLSRYVGS